MGAFNYLEKRITNDCAAAYHYSDNYRVWELAQYFDPSFAAQHLTEDRVRALVDITPIWYANMLKETPAYLAACVGVTIDDSDMGTFTAAILSFWRNNCRKFPAWAKAARMVFAMTPNSAGAERVFSLLEHFFGSTRDGSLADLIEGSLMLKYNNTKRRKELEA